MIKDIKNYSNEELELIKDKINVMPTYFAIDEESCKMIKELALKHGFTFSYNLKKEMMFLEYNKYNTKKTFINDDLSYKGMYFPTMYNEIYIPQGLLKFNQSVFDVQFLLSVIQGYFYSLSYINPSFEEFDHEGYPYKVSSMIITFNYLWKDLIPNTLKENAKSENEHNIPFEAWIEFVKELTNVYFVKIGDLYNKLNLG